MMSGEDLQRVRGLIQAIDQCSEQDQQDEVLRDLEQYLAGGGNPNGGAPAGAGTLLGNSILVLQVQSVVIPIPITINGSYL